MAEGMPESIWTWILGGLTTLFGAAGTVISFLFFRAETANGKTLEVVQAQQAETKSKLDAMTKAHQDCEDGKAELMGKCIGLEKTCEMQGRQIAKLESQVSQLRQS
jgi:hypothetical protein